MLLHHSFLPKVQNKNHNQTNAKMSKKSEITSNDIIAEDGREWYVYALFTKDVVVSTEFSLMLEKVPKCDAIPRMRTI